MIHRHHIVPKHVGGTDDSSNIAYLTVEEHAEAHRLLFEKYGRWQDRLAWRGLAGIITHEEAVAESLKNSFLGRKHTKETKKKMRLSRMKWTLSEESKKKMGNSRRGERNPMYRKIFSDTHREKLRAARLGVSFSNEWKQNISKGKKGKVWMFNPVTIKSMCISKEEALVLTSKGWLRGRK